MSTIMDPKLLPFALQDVPRYTSYPTAVQFQDGFPGEKADRWLAELPPDAALSIYVHVPFCQQLCWYCGCHTSVPNSYGRASAYLDSLLSDITRSSKLSGTEKGNVKHLHFGGGTPTYLSNADLGRILACINGSFGLAPGAEIALESDPRGITRDRAFGLCGHGLQPHQFRRTGFFPSRADEDQPPADLWPCRPCDDLLREAGFTSINFDLDVRASRPNRRQRAPDRKTGGSPQAQPHLGIRLCPRALVQEAPAHDFRCGPARRFGAL